MVRDGLDIAVTRPGETGNPVIYRRVQRVVRVDSGAHAEKLSRNIYCILGVHGCHIDIKRFRQVIKTAAPFIIFDL